MVYDVQRTVVYSWIYFSVDLDTVNYLIYPYN